MLWQDAVVSESKPVVKDLDGLAAALKAAAVDGAKAKKPEGHVLPPFVPLKKINKMICYG